ncbi:lactate dehydrogenase B [Coemansia reversa NRRL 1564]|uniref:L-lactate dehydrogenase n=1 Tax=Coemansia reversa (strain ATCC 12441 / NRRL 1564) TaxID=763665 RepID=A0A2G5B6R7_COERN|nr:lactate dehydrogenase B [Coemansia reversa NRRL 1564]|eukprot:PIA14682.1 lactate dehydrogenase B [Coemansia reversa NRRL 1564]
MASVPKQRVSVIGGGGNVGAATAFSLIAKGVPAEVLVVDVVDKAAEGQALDISDAAFMMPGICRKGTFKEAGQSDVIIVTAGARQQPNEPRSALIDRNYKIIKSIMDSLQPIKQTAKILMVSNPVDVLTDIAQKTSGLPRNQVIGSGTYLDSGRLRNALSEITGVSPTSIHAYMLGEHGDNQFTGWSSARIGGRPLLEHPKMKEIDLDKIYEQIQRKAYVIIEAKGSTYYGIGICAATIAEALLNNTNQVFPIVNYVEKFGCYLSWPAAIGCDGVEQSFDVKLDSEECKKLDSAINAIKEVCSKYN